MKQISISSEVFRDGSSIPVEYTCDGEDRSPALIWDTVPAGTQSIALIIDDPDAPGQTFVHWVIYNIPANTADYPGVCPGTRPWTTAACSVNGGVKIPTSQFLVKQQNFKGFTCLSGSLNIP